MHALEYDSIELFGVRMANVSSSDFIHLICQAIDRRAKLIISFVNPHSVYLFRSHPDLRRLLNEFDIVGVDGIGVILASRVLGTPLRERVSADSLSPLLFGTAARRKYKVFLLGAADGVADAAARNLPRMFPGLDVTGVHHGYFSQEGDQDVVTSLNETKADIVLIGLGAPLQEQWTLANYRRVDAPVMMTCGGLLDMIARRVQYYPPWVHQLRLNWLYRFINEPRRLWKRYTIEACYFAFLVLSHRVFKARK